MKTLRRWFGGVLATLCVAAPALGDTVATAPRVDGFDVEEVTQLTSGTALRFSLYGTPGAAASLHIDGAQRGLALQETQSGIYEGTYTITPADRITPRSRVIADLALGPRVSSALLEEPLLLGAPAVGVDAASQPPPVAAAAPAAAAPVTVAAVDGCTDCGVVQAIRAVEQREPRTRGAATGGVIGAILDSEFVEDARRTAAQIIGALSGDAPRQVGRASPRRTRYDIVVRFDNGDVQTRRLDAPPPFKVGDRVRVVQGRPLPDNQLDPR